MFSGGEGGQPARCAPAVAHRLQQLYDDALRLFEQAYISSLNFVSRMKAASQASQPQAQPQPPTEADYEALLAITSSEFPSGPVIMNMLPRFAHASGAELEARGVPQPVVAYVERFRELLQQMSLHDIQFIVQPELPQPTGMNCVGSVTGAGQGCGQRLPPVQQPSLTIDELEEAVRAVRI